MFLYYFQTLYQDNKSLAAGGYLHTVATSYSLPRCVRPANSSPLN